MNFFVNFFKICIIVIWILDIIIDRKTFICINKIKIGCSFTVFIIYMVRSCCQTYSLWYDQDRSIRNMQLSLVKEQWVRLWCCVVWLFMSISNFGIGDIYKQTWMISLGVSNISSCK